MARALALAFHDDPVQQWLFPDEERRRPILERGFELFLRRAWLPGGECFTSADRTGAACWLPPGEVHLSPLRQLALLPALLPALLRLGRSRAPLFLRAQGLTESKHPKGPPHWYLPVVGVAPEGQGRGLGSRLMHPVLERCDAERLPAYLEASTPRSRALYERHGFAVTDELRMPKGGPPVWLMWREPS